MGTDFVHLHTHSHYSLLEAVPKIPDLVAAAKADGQSALALTDNGNLYGAIEFYKECVKAGIKPILGVDFFIASRTRHNKEHGVDDKSARLLLLAKNENGYRNLVKLVSRSFTEGLYALTSASYVESVFARPRIDRELIEQYRDDLIAILPSHGGEVAYSLRHQAAEKAEEIFEWYRRIYGKDLYIEITHHPEIIEHDERMRTIVAFAKKHKAQLLAAHDVYYLKSDDSLAADLVNKIRTGGTIDRDNEDYRPRNFSFIPKETMMRSFAEFPEALENSVRIANECTLELTLGKAIFPTFPIPKGKTDNGMLREKAEKGITLRGMEDTPQLRARMDYELDIIEKKGYASYFLIVADLLGHAREKGILTNTRGSAAGSLVSYLCGITTVDPIAFQMPFERFLNPERPSAPDIDMDIADDRRDELIEYAKSKYGEDHVVQIGTFGTMMARAAVRDVSRALGYSYSIGDAIAKLIPIGKQGFPVTIDGALKEVPELKEAYEKDPATREVLDLAQKIEGNVRHVGVHAAGVVITPGPVTDFTPIQPDPKGGKLITQYDMYSITDEYGGVGVLKFDFLGLKNLSVLADSVKRVKSRLGETVDLYRLPLDDKKVYAMLARGETLGVFQMAGSGMTAYLKELRPTVVHDLNAMVALYRPGPMAFIPDYIARKRDPSRVKYLDPRMEKILKPTYGVLIYQDDVMMIAVELAGYSWGEADKLRKAMGKKIPEEMAKQKDRLIKGCIERGMKENIAHELWQQIETFAAYGFNKAHAASYGNLAYKTAYMKANYPVDYMAAVLTADAGDVEKIAEIVAECKRMGIEVLPPSVNESYGNFTVVEVRPAHVQHGSKGMQGHAIRFGLYSIKNFGTGVADSIIQAREAGLPGQGGKFKDMADFLERVHDKTLNKKSLESLIMCGAFDDLGVSRGINLANIETLLAYHREHASTPSAQASLFGGSGAPKAVLKLDTAERATKDERLKWEKELLGLFVSGHPLDKHKDKFNDEKKTVRYAIEHLKGVETVIAGYLEDRQTILTKKGERMGFFHLSDRSGSIEVVAFPRALKEFDSVLQEGACVALKGRISERNGEPSFVAEKAKVL